MIARLTGHVEAHEDGSVTVDVGGVGYEVFVPLGTVGRLARDEQGRVTLQVQTIVREDAFLLYGFATLEDRAAFRILLGVASVGPKIALAILGALPIAELASAIARKEIARLTAISGVGKKTAERLLLELKDKVVAPTHVQGAPIEGPSSKIDLLRGALEHMGFRPAQVDSAIATIKPKIAELELRDLVREALAVLR